MPTYTATIDTTGMGYPIPIYTITYRTCQFVFGDLILNDISELAIGLKTDLESHFAVNGVTTTVTATVNDLIIELNFTLTDEDIALLPCEGEIVGLQINDQRETIFTYCFNTGTPVEPTLCKTCQEVTMDNCGSVIFEAAIQDGTYKVRILDNQSGVFYYQNIEFTSSQGIWDQTNTAGVFTPFSIYTVTILDDNGDPVSWVDGTNEYNCMHLTFNTFTDTTPEG